MSFDLNLKFINSCYVYHISFMYICITGLLSCHLTMFTIYMNFLPIQICILKFSFQKIYFSLVKR